MKRRLLIEKDNIFISFVISIHWGAFLPTFLFLSLLFGRSLAAYWIPQGFPQVQMAHITPIPTTHVFLGEKLKIYGLLTSRLVCKQIRLNVARFSWTKNSQDAAFKEIAVNF